jgi:hypothetical protein
MDDYSMTEIAFAPHRGDERLYVEFRTMAFENAELSATAGRSIFEDREVVSLRAPGSRDELIERVTDEHRRRFPRQYAAFKEGKEAAVIGTPLANLPGMSPAQLEEFAFFRVKTIEALAELNDTVAAKFHGIQALKAKAKAFIEAAAGAAPALKLQEELKTRDDEIAVLRRQIEELAASVADKNKGKK